MSIGESIRRVDFINIATRLRERLNKQLPRAPQSRQQISTASKEPKQEQHEEAPNKQAPKPARLECLN